MKLLTTIVAVLISISAYSQDYIDYDNGTFTQNGEELSMEQIDDLTVLHKTGRGNFRRANRFISLHKNQTYPIAKNIGSFVVGSAAGLFGVPSFSIGGLIPLWVDVPGLSVTFVVGIGLCAVSYKAFSRIVVSPQGYLRRIDEEFHKIAYKINRAIQSSNQ